MAKCSRRGPLASCVHRATFQILALLFHAYSAVTSSLYVHSVTAQTYAIVCDPTSLVSICVHPICTLCVLRLRPFT